MRGRLYCLRIAIAVTILLAMGAAAWAEGNWPGKVTRRAYFAWFDHNGAYFALEGFSYLPYAHANRTVYVPRLSKATLAGDQYLFSFHNGAPGQQDVIDGVPDDPRYSPIMRVLILVWRRGVTPRLLTSYKDVYTHNQAGRLFAYDTGVRLNGPVVWQDTGLDGRSGRRAPTLLRGVQFLALRPRSGNGNGEVDLTAYPCYWNGSVVAFTDLDHADGLVPDAEGNIVEVTAVPRIGLPVMSTAAVAKFYAIEGQDPVVDGVPGLSDYSPLWQILLVLRKPGFTRLLTSEEAVVRAAAAGLVSIEPLGENAVFNGPIIHPSLVQPLD